MKRCRKLLRSSWRPQLTSTTSYNIYIYKCSYIIYVYLNISLYFPGQVQAAVRLATAQEKVESHSTGSKDMKVSKGSKLKTSRGGAKGQGKGKGSKASKKKPQGQEPADQGKEPADQGKAPADHGKEPADQGKEPADQGKEQADQGKEPADHDQGKEPDQGKTLGVALKFDWKTKDSCLVYTCRLINLNSNSVDVHPVPHD